LVADRCANCHVEGGIAPFALASYDDVFGQRMAIRTAVSQRMMPPWLAAKGCTEYAFDLSLSDEQVAMVSEWVDSGAPEGRQSGAQPEPSSDLGGLTRVD